jgi:pimeloyl-ACP methyl ester carboxylesterase
VRQRRHPARELFWRGLVAVAGTSLMVAGLYPVVPHLGMMLARARKRRRAARGARSGGEPAAQHRPGPSQARVLAREWAVSVAMSLARPAGFFAFPDGSATAAAAATAEDATGPRPIVVVHGYAMNRANFLPLARRLAAAGLGPITGFEYWSLGKTADAARALAAYVEELCAATGAREVDLIGHSMGGVVSRYYVQLGGGDPRVRHLITIGSPHHGTDISAVGIGRPAKELFFGSVLLQRLEAARPPAHTRITVIWSRSDAMVPGRHQAHIPDPEHRIEELVYDDLGHLSMLVDRRVAAAIIERLRAR